ncbi:MAG: tail fiber domain-containing protein [Phycisphaerales bacterium]|nr:tail fiber domain-containing protein [Phycisphaerales bacterium]
MTRSPLTHIIIVVTMALIAAASAGAIGPVADTSITYQAQLQQNGAVVEGACDFIFSLWDAPTGGDNLGPVLQVNALPIADGLVTTTLDFGPEAFSGDARWLQVAARCPSGSGPFITLAPRQRLTGAPYTLRALNQNTLSGADGSPNPAVFVDVDGRVGVGTETPTSLLTADGVIESTTGGFLCPDGSTLASTNGLVNQVTPGSGLLGGGSGPAVTLDVAWAGNGSANTVARSNHWHNTLAASDGNPLSAVHVDASGLVGIGTTTPSTLLHLQSTSPLIWYTDTNDPTGTNWTLGNVNGTFRLTNQSFGGNPINITPDNFVGIGGISGPVHPLQVAGNICAADYLTCSDVRLKEDIEPITDALAAVRCLRGVTFSWISDGAPHPDRHYGFLAQEVREVLPDLVNAADPQSLSVRYTGLVPVLTEALQELDARVRERDATIARQGEDIARLSADLQQAVARLGALEAATKER